MSKRLKKAKDFFLELIFPTFCLVCRKEDTHWVCTSCFLKLQPKTNSSCPVCLKTPGTYICTSCRAKTTLSSLTYCYSYEDKRIAALIHAFKYRNIQNLANFFAEKMFQKISYYPFKDSWLTVPVPLHWQRMNERGYNQSELIAQKLSMLTKVPSDSTALVRRHYTKTQTQFSKEERQKNLAGQFVVMDSEKIASKNILLIDDVATTLATLETCASALKTAGAQNVWAITIARAE